MESGVRLTSGIVIFHLGTASWMTCCHWQVAQNHSTSDQNMDCLITTMEEILDFVDDVESLKGKVKRTEQTIGEILSEIERCSKFIEQFLVKDRRCKHITYSIL